MGRSTWRHFIDSLRCISCVILLAFVASNARAFDGHRKGFVLGIGAGVSPVAHYERTQVDIENTRASLVFDLLIGHGFSERNLLLVDYRLAPHGVDGVPDLNVAQAFVVLSWYHYLSTTNKSLFSSIGLGEAVLMTMDVRRFRPYNKLYDDHWNSGGTGWGMTLGLGYQFASHFQISSNWCMGSFTLEHSSRLSQFMIDVTGVLILF